MITVSLEALREVSSHKPSGYLEDVLSNGKVNGVLVIFDERIYSALREKYSPQTQKLSLGQKARNAAGATTRVIKAVATGQQVVVDQAEQDRRMTICTVCEFFTGTTCRKCGCHIRFKAKLQTEHCPILKW